MPDRRLVSSGNRWEPVVGYSRAVRTGPAVWVAGTTATDDTGSVIAPGDPYLQTVAIIRKIAEALEAVDARLEHVVRTRMFVTCIDRWKEIARAHGEAFGSIRPASTMVEVVRLIHPDMMIEIEADAWVPG